jgi:hypothetical protein
MEESLAAEQAVEMTGPAAALVEQAFAEYLGHWNRLVSTTNWEKGHIISQWRRRLMETGAPQQVYSDEAWSRRVGNVSGQHVGRLRRVYEQFGEVYPQYPGLYWSHFQAAVDWPDAEMWLEGAVHSGWSVAQMRAQRWEALGRPEGQRPADEEFAAAEPDDDLGPAEDAAPSSRPSSVEGSMSVVEGPDFGDEGEASRDGTAGAAPWEETDPSSPASRVEPVRPFEHLGKLPEDLAAAFESFKLAILAHKLTGWTDISCGEVLAALDALKQLASAPAGQ